MSKSSRVLILALMLITGATLSGCGKKRAMKEEFKPRTQSKDLVSTDQDYTYLISVSDSDPRADSSRPHWQSYAKTVRMKFLDHSLEVFQVNRDKAVNQNKLASKSVISIPIKAVDYRCKENGFKECTGVEEENKDTVESQRRFFIPDLDKTEILEKSFLPIALDGIDEKNSCFTKVKQTAVDGKIDKDSINFELETEYNAKPDCISLGNVEGIEDFLEKMNFKVRYYVSIVKTSTLADPQYKEVIYPVADQRKFGFFTTEESVLDVDNRQTENGRIVKLDRWSPNKKKLIYYLNDAFESPENAQLKTLSFKAGEAVNQALKAAGANIDFEIQTGQKEMVPENLRNSMIVLVPEPLDSGLLGYGPHASNPATGEILHASVVMYAGNMKQSLYRTWDEIVRTYVEEQKPKASVSDETKKESNAALNLIQKMSRSLGPTFKSDLADIFVPKADVLKKSQKNGENIKLKIPGINIDKVLKETTKYVNHAYIPKERILGLEQKRDADINDVNEALKRSSLMDYYSRNNYYHSDVFNFEGAVLAAFKGKIPSSLLKPWAQLTASERQDVINLTLPQIWSVTLIHEIGHTLGLRHNFAGSEDKDNYYSEAELKQEHGIDYPVKFSSVMEYPFSDIGALPIMGKYDIAALAYGYSRKLFTKNGKMVDIADGGIEATEAQGADLKEFSYCTDENVDANPGCKRFDAGTTLPEIAQHLVNTYESFYQYRNKRNGRRSFSATTDGNYAVGTAQNFRYMRMFFERYEDLAEKLPMTDHWADPAYVSNPVIRQYLKELNDSVVIIGNHFMNVLMEPDQTCVIYEVATKQTVALPLFTWMDRRSAGLNNVNPDLFSCSQIASGSETHKMLAELGKSFGNKKAPDNQNMYADQIDVRGIWPDKLLAAHYLLARTIGISTSDKFTANFLQVPELQGQLIVLLKALIMDEVEREFEVPTAQGVLRIDTYTPMAISHFIRPSMSELANQMFGISGEFRFAKSLLRAIKKYGPSATDREITEPILENFRIYTNLTTDEVVRGKFLTMNAVSERGTPYFYKEENTLAKGINTRLNILDNLQGISAESANKIIKAIDDLSKVADQKDKSAKIEEIKKSLSEVEVKSFMFFSELRNGAHAIQQAFGGNIQNREYFDEILAEMAR